MKQISLFSFLAFILVFTSCNGNAQNNGSTKKVKINKIEVIDFYGTHRCVTCKAIESNAKYTVDTYFAAEKKKGTVVFKKINVDDDKNYKTAEKFQATGTALFLNVIIDGKETHIDLTDFAFSKGKDKEAFSKELKAKIEKELSKL